MIYRKNLSFLALKLPGGGGGVQFVLTFTDSLLKNYKIILLPTFTMALSEYNNIYKANSSFLKINGKYPGSIRVRIIQYLYFCSAFQVVNVLLFH